MLEFKDIQQLCPRADIIAAAGQAAAADVADLGDNGLPSLLQREYSETEPFNAVADAAIGKMQSEIPLAGTAKHYVREAFLAWFGQEAILDGLDKKKLLARGEKEVIRERLASAQATSELARLCVKALGHIRGVFSAKGLEDGSALAWLKGQHIQAYYGAEKVFKGACVTVDGPSAGIEKKEGEERPSIVIYTAQPPLLIVSRAANQQAHAGTANFPAAEAKAMDGLITGKILAGGGEIYAPPTA